MLFTPDGSNLFTIVSDAKGSRLVEIPVNGAQGMRDRMVLPREFTRLQDISTDGRTLLLNRGVGDTSVFSVSLDGTSAEPRKLVDTGETVINSSFSPDGHWILYQATSLNETGIYVQPFPGPGLRQQIASSGGYPVWRKDGREIVYIGEHQGRQYIWSVMVDTAGGPFHAGTPEPLFPIHLPAATFGDLNFLTVSRDGSRFFIPQAVEQPNSDSIHIKIGGIR
jgi:Tol biopolymer transport system component